jgi:class 3 adenylate cyclase/pimeloyl-ACP methyl ester carboxylesterase
VADIPETKFTKVGGDRVAYQVLGDGPIDLVYLPSIGDCIDVRWEFPPYVSFLSRLSSFSRLIMFDRRGIGASNSVPLEPLPGWEECADDARAVMDAVGSERAAIFGVNEASRVAMLFAATQPERTRGLTVFNGSASTMSDPAVPGGMSDTLRAELSAIVEEVWGTETLVQVSSPDLADDRVYAKWLAKTTRMACSPREAAAYIFAIQRVDIRPMLPTIRVPTLVLNRKDQDRTPLDSGQYLADHIPDARFVVIPGTSVHPYLKPTSLILDEVEGFITGTPPSKDNDRALAAILFTDIVGSTERAAALGDRRWRNVLETHLGLTRTIVDEHRGRVVKATGDGVLATFDGPGRAIRCAFALNEAVRPLGVEIRAGLHTGEVEVIEDDVGGIAVHIAARVMAQAGPGELLVSGVVPPLVAGSGIEFDDRGEHELRGVPGTWKLFAVAE